MSNETLYYDALKHMAKYKSSDWLRSHAEKEYGLPYEETLEAAYDNLREEIRYVLRGKRRPRPPMTK